MPTGVVRLPQYMRVKSIENYDDVAQVYASVTPWKGSDDRYGRRPLHASRAKHMSIQRVPSSDDSVLWDDYALIHYETELVRYRKDGSIRVRPYKSVSSINFVNSVLPRHTSISATGAELTGKFWLHVNDAYHCVGPEFELGGTTGKIVYWRGGSAMKIPTFDQAGRLQALAAYPAYAEFRAWAIAMEALKQPDLDEIPELLLTERSDILKALNDRNMWPSLFYLHGTGIAEIATSNVREAIYFAERVPVVFREEKMFEKMSQLLAAMRQCRKFKYTQVTDGGQNA